MKCNLSNNRFYKNKTWSTDNLHMFSKHCKASKQCMILKWWAQNTPMKWMKEQAVEILKLALCQSQKNRISLMCEINHWYEIIS